MPIVVEPGRHVLSVVVAVVFPVVKIAKLLKGFNVAKTFEGVSLAWVIVPLVVKLFELPDESRPMFPELSIFKKKPFVPYVTEGEGFGIHTPFESDWPNEVGVKAVPSTKLTWVIKPL